ncbi:GDSL-type esterase/lipase family protein [Neobacillus vireti]|uniref:GDSL-type esterase/lipase family protein n=1 Tax=Neobacillus vireti TaxID=220686 RepID=UPI002FFF63E7
MEKELDKELIMNILLPFFQNQKNEKVKNYKILNQYVQKGKILFVGSSLMENFPIYELQKTLDKDYCIYNRGVGGFTTTELLSSMNECIFELEPAKIFINIGTNDIGSPDFQKENLLANYDTILSQIGDKLPDCKVYVMAYYPVNAKVYFPSMDESTKEVMFKTRTNQAILDANESLKELAKKHHYEFINVNEGLMDSEGNLKEEYAIDGIHMLANGYRVVLDSLKQFL